MLALGLSRAGKPARAERALILLCAAASAYMNVSGADVASPRSVVAYAVALIALAVCRFTQNDPFSWTAGTMTDLGTFSATAMSEATAVNRGGNVVGGSGGHALFVHNGTMTDLGTLGSTQSAAYAINDNGQVTGWAHTASEATHVFMWSNGTITDLGTFGLDPVGEAINNHGVIVGQSSLGAWIWRGGVVQNLNNLIPPGSGFTLDNATAINDNWSAPIKVS